MWKWLRGKESKFPKKCFFYGFASIGTILALCVGVVDAFAETKAVRGKEVTRIAEDLKKAIVSQDTKRILSYVGKGIYCVDSLVEFEKVKKDLNDPQSDLYVTLFGREGMREFFKNAKDQKTRIDFMVVNGKEDPNWVCLRYTSSDYDGKDWPEICLGFQKGKWSINNSLYHCL